MLPGGHRLLSEYFQSRYRKRRYDEATDELLCSNLLFWFSGQAGDEYHVNPPEYYGNPPNILVICRIFAEYFAKCLSLAIELFLFLRVLSVV